jgi:hypothetical protein
MGQIKHIARAYRKALADLEAGSDELDEFEELFAIPWL